MKLLSGGTGSRRTLLVALLLVASIAGGCDGPVSERADVGPLVGIWQTTNTRYQNRALRISMQEILIVDVAGGPPLGGGPIVDVRKIDIGDTRIQYEISYSDPFGPQEMVLEYLPGLGEVRVRNQKGVVWKRAQS